MASAPPSRRHNIQLGLGGSPFYGYTIQFDSGAPQGRYEVGRDPSSDRKCSSTTGCSIVEGCLTVVLLFIITLYAVDCNLELRQTKLQAHLAICTIATLISVVHIACQSIIIVRADQIHSLYDNAAVELLTDTDNDFNETRPKFGTWCYKLVAERENVFPIVMGVAAVIADVFLLIVFYACRIDLGWMLIPSVLFPVSMSVFRMTARGRLFRKWAKRDADVSRVVILEAARLLREQQLLLPAESSSVSPPSDG